MQRINNISKIMIFGLGVIIASLVLVAGYLVINPKLALEQFSGPEFALPTLPPLVGWQIASLTCLMVLSLVPALYVAWQFLRMFQGFARSEIFTKLTTKHIFNAAKGLFICVLVAILNTTVAVLIITANAAPGEHVLVLSISMSDIMLILAGIMLLAMSWVMQEATQLSDENAGFI